MADPIRPSLKMNGSLNLTQRILVLSGTALAFQFLPISAHADMSPPYQSQSSESDLWNDSMSDTQEATLAQAEAGKKKQKVKGEKKKGKKKLAPNSAPAATETPASSTEETTPTEETETTTAQEADTAETPAQPVGDTSRDARGAKSLYVGAMTGFIPRFAYGVELGYNSSPSLSLESFLETGSFEFLNYSSSRMRIGARAMWFTGNSFFLAGGLAYDSYTSKFDSILGSYSWEGSISQIEIEASIGNRWAFASGFFVGAHWIGYSLGVTELSREAKATGTATGDQEDKNEESLDDLTTNFLGIHFAKLQLGWAF
jgi:hypothetical protein